MTSLFSKIGFGLMSTFKIKPVGLNSYYSGIVMHFFEKVILSPPDPILGLTTAFENDLREEKVNLGVGLYKSDDLKTPILKCVKSAEKILFEIEKSKTYLPIEGDSLFLEKMGQLVFSSAFWSKQRHRIAAIQTVGGTGALRIGGAFLKEEVSKEILIPHPTWPNHNGVFSACGFNVQHYPYYDKKNHAAAVEKMLDSFAQQSEKSVILFHAACHNPTGADPTLEQWKELANQCYKKSLLPFFDFAYQGFGNGIEEDATAIRLFAEQGLDMLVAISCAKNFSLYGERVGALFLLTDSQKAASAVLSRIKQVARTTYSNPPLHGEKLVACVLNTPLLRHQWLEELAQMRKRIFNVRQKFCQKLNQETSSDFFNHMEQGKGMFGFTGLNQTEVEKLKTEFGIYMTLDGRINVCGLNDSNIDYVVNAIKKVRN